MKDRTPAAQQKLFVRLLQFYGGTLRNIHCPRPEKRNAMITLDITTKAGKELSVLLMGECEGSFRVLVPDTNGSMTHRSFVMNYLNQTYRRRLFPHESLPGSVVLWLQQYAGPDGRYKLPAEPSKDALKLIETAADSLYLSMSSTTTGAIIYKGKVLLDDLGVNLGTPLQARVTNTTVNRGKGRSRVCVWPKEEAFNPRRCIIASEFLMSSSMSPSYYVEKHPNGKIAKQFAQKITWTMTPWRETFS